MRTRNLVLSVLVGMGVASCGENNPPPTSEKPALTDAKPYGQNKLEVPQPQAASNPTPVNSVASKHTEIMPASPIPPSSAQWTIACDTVEGPAHITQAEMVKQRLMDASHMPDWYAIHSENKSEIYYGYYGAIDNPAEKRREEADRRRIAALMDRLGNPLVRGTVLQPVSVPDPTSPPEWNLLNTPHDSYWTIEYATFVDSPHRKEAAVQMVEALRKSGESRAYYYHGQTVSSVCIGAWKREAVAEQGTRSDAKGQLRDDANTQSADQPLLVIPDIVPPTMPGRVLEPGTGKPMTVEALRLDVLDPDMKAAMVKYHDHIVNYEVSGKSDNGKFIADASMLVAIPHDQSPVTDENYRIAGGQSVPSAPPQRVRGAGDDVLRSIGGH